MRTIDRFVGVPLCWMAAAWNRMLRPRTGRAKLEGVLVMKFFGMGSVLLTSPVVTALKRAHPAVRIAYLTFAQNGEILSRLHGIDLPLLISTTSAGAFVRSTLSALIAIRRMQVDVVLDLEFFSKFSTLVSVLSGAPTRIGFDLPTRWRRSNLTARVPLDHGTHVTREFVQQLTRLGIKGNPDEVMRLAATREETESMKQKLSVDDNGVESICININAGSTSLERRWPAERFGEIVHTLMSERPARRFFFIGVESEREYVHAVLRSCPEISSRSVNCAGVLTLGELIALLQHSSLLLTNDTGPMHIAAAVGTRVVALFGPESPRFYGPLGRARIMYKGLPCSPCLNVYNAKMFVCPYDARCMKEITVEEVMDAIRLIMQEAAQERVEA